MVSFRSIAAIGLAAASVNAENILRFVSTDSTDRTVYIVANAGIEGHDPVDIPAGSTVDVTLVDSFIGNAYSVSQGAENVPGMLAEVNFQAYQGLTFFDVSAIVDSTDKDGVHLMYPADSKTPTSGCETFPCDNAYYLPDDIQTKSTDETTIIVTLGSGSTSNSTSTATKKRSARYSRGLVTGAN